MSRSHRSRSRSKSARWTAAAASTYSKRRRNLADPGVALHQRPFGSRPRSRCDRRRQSRGVADVGAAVLLWAECSRALRQIDEGGGWGAMFIALSELDLLVIEGAPDSGTLEHPVLERGLVRQLGHRKLAAHSPGVEDEAVGIEHGIPSGKPFTPGQHAVDLLQITMERLESHLLDGGEG